MFRKLFFVSALWLSASLSMKTSLDIFLGNTSWGMSLLTDCRNMLSTGINTLLNSSKHTLTHCSAADVHTDTPDFTSKWMVTEDPNPPKWMEQGILLP